MKKIQKKIIIIITKIQKKKKLGKKKIKLFKVIIVMKI
jgi:hypothetical protein